MKEGWNIFDQDQSRLGRNTVQDIDKLSTSYRQDIVTACDHGDDVVVHSPSYAIATELIQNRFPVGSGPSSKTCPRCESQLAHLTSVRRIP